MTSPRALLERLQEIPGYAWDTQTEPFHSSYGAFAASSTFATIASAWLAFSVPTLTYKQITGTSSERKPPMSP